MKPGNVLRGLLMAVLFLVACEPLTADSAGAATTIPRLDPGDTNPIVEFDAGDLALQDGDVVSAWGGQSAVGHPTYLTVQTPNGRPAVAFNGAGDRMGDNIPLSASPAGDWVLVAVIKPKNTGVYHNLVDDDAQNRPMLWIDPGFNYELNYAGGSGAKGAGSGPGGWDIVIADSRLNQLYINSPVPNATGGDSIPLTAPESFDFFHRDGNQTYTGLVAELRIYNDRADFGGDFAALYNEMTAKWFLTNFHADPLGSLRNQTFENQNLSGAVFTGQDLTGANFNGATLSGADFTNTILNGTSFVSATLDAVDFSYAIIKCADFSYTKLLTTRFGPYQEITPGDDCHTKFAHSAIDINAIDTEHWGNADFSYTRFQNVSPSTFSLQGKTISGAILAGVNLSSIDMSGADLTGVDFSNATLNNVNLDNAALNGATLTLAKLSYASARCARFHGSNADNPNNPNSVACPNTRTSDDPNLNADLTQATLIQTDLTNATLDNAILTGANLSGAALRNASFVNANLEPSGTLPAASVLGADLSGAIFSMAHVNNVQFNEVLLTGAIFDRSTLQGTNFTDSVMPNASFEQATLEAVNFHNAILQHANFAAATMKTTPGGGGSGVDFTCAQLGGANFADATVTAATFQSAVMPPASDCCRPAAGDPWCGYINATQQPYGPVTYPVLNANVTCPNGEIAPCSGDQWKIPSWRTNLCSPDRAMKTVWRPPSCDAPPADVVVFEENSKLKPCILAALPGQPSEISNATAAEIREVNCPGLGIEDEDIRVLEKFTNLVTLDLTANQLTQFSFDLPKLQKLVIADNQLTVLDVGGLPSLTWVEASNNQLGSISGLAEFQPNVLDLSHNQFTEFDLAILQDLEFVDLSHNKLTAIWDDQNPSLSSLEALQSLDLSNNSLTTIGSLEDIAYTYTGNGDAAQTEQGSLFSLFLACNPTFQCSTLGLDEDNHALQTSSCAEQSAGEKWVMREYPSCLP